MAQWREVDAPVLLKLKEARRRLALATFLRAAPWALLVSVAALFLYRSLLVISGVQTPLTSSQFALAFGAPLLVAALLAIWRWRSLATVARQLDYLAATKDRFSTFLSLKEAGPSEFGRLSAREIAAYAPNLRLEQKIHLALPRRPFLWLILPLAALVALSFVSEARRAANAPAVARASTVLKKVRAAAARQPVPDRTAIQDIDQALERVQTSSDPWKAALSALADLENKMSAGGSAQSGLTAEEAKALAAAVAPQNPDLAQQLRGGNQADAAAAISKMDPAAVKKAMSEAAQYLKDQRLRDLAQQESGAAQRSLAKIMKSSSSPSDGSNGDGKRQLASALRDARNDAMSDDPSQSDSGKGDSPDSPNGKKPANSNGQADNQPPGGAPGSDKDSGTGGQIAGQRDARQSPSAQDDSISSILGPGSSLVETYRAAGSDRQKAQRAYRDAYQTAAAAALDSIDHEEIPAGSRLLVKRYFESIRPAE